MQIRHLLEIRLHFFQKKVLINMFACKMYSKKSVRSYFSLQKFALLHCIANLVRRK